MGGKNNGFKFKRHASKILVGPPHPETLGRITFINFLVLRMSQHWQFTSKQAWSLEVNLPSTYCIVVCFEEWPQSIRAGFFLSGSKLKAVLPASTCVPECLMNADPTQHGYSLSKVKSLKQMDIAWTCGPWHQLLHPPVLPCYLLM